MNIILANYRYFISGGPERYMFNVQKQLESQGHTVIPFSIDYAKNQLSPYSQYFVTSIGSKEQVYFDQHGKSPATIVKTLSRLFYSREVEKAVLRIADEQKPEVAYILHYLRKLSPALLVGLKKRNLPIVVRLSDYAMLCPEAHCLHNGAACTLCVKGNLLPSIKNRCLKQSFPASLLNAIATWYHRNRRFFDLIDKFVCTNAFMYQMMIDAGYPESKLACIPTFTDTSFFKPITNYEKSDYIAYCGRVTSLKGIHILLEAYALLQKKGYRFVRLKIAGTGELDYLNQCREIVHHNSLEAKVDFVGEMDSKSLSGFLSKALFTAVPSLWYENLPNSLIESMACGTPVIASDIGSLSNCIENGKNGFLFTPGDSYDLTEKMACCLDNETLLKSMARNARVEAESRYSPIKHIDTLMQVFLDIL